MRFPVILTVLICAVFFGVATAHAERRVALVIGNSTYQHTRALANPRNDAEAVAKLLGANGFDDVALKLDLDYRGMREVVRLFGEKARSADIAVVYYAGHGLEVGSENYLIPIDARLIRDLDLEFEAVTLASILKVVEGARKLKLVILDACRTNTLGEKMNLPGRATRSVGRGLARIEPRGDVLVAYSARAGTLAQDGSGKHSPYAEALLKHMGTPGLDVIRMFGRVKEAVVAATKRGQEPWIYGSPGGESIALVDAKPTPPTGSGPAGPAADELAWGLVKDTKDPAMLRRFVAQFPQSSKRADAEKRAAELTAMLPAPTPIPAPKSPSEAKSGTGRGNSKCFTFQGRQFCE